MEFPTIPKEYFPALITVSFILIGISIFFYYSPKDAQIQELSQPLGFLGVVLLLYSLYKWSEEREKHKFKISLP